MKTLIRIRGGQNMSFAFFRFPGLFSRGLNDLKEFQSLSPEREGDWRMKDTDHPISHARVHLPGRASARGRSACARQDAQFGRGQITALGGATPLLHTVPWPK
jgi:hypothetical protein